MTKMDLVSYLLGLDRKTLSKAEKLFLETKLFHSINDELLNIFKSQYMNYLNLIKTQEEPMINFTQEMIKDILLTEEYSLAGIATHTHIPEDVLFDILSGINTNPTLELSRKLFELHMTVRRNLYDNIMEKILSEYLAHGKRIDVDKN